MRQAKLEFWAGIEGTINRVGDHYFDQCATNGHDQRIQDLDLLADLGIKALRYPVLWERHAPNEDGAYDWTFADERLGRLRELGVEPIAGLLHHGSGPAHTSLLDPRFTQLLARYARAVAERYPWVTMWTPVNEPLTTARFSALYGHWYPHEQSFSAFARALVNQCLGTAAAMREIRAVNPEAKLVQTEDLGYTHSTPLLSAQAAHENERRWLSFDLLCGRVRPEHPAWKALRGAGIAERCLESLALQPAMPDILGVNHYLTSERFLDEDESRFPPSTHGGNGKLRYADEAAVRVRGVALLGFRGLLRQAWERYRIPLAITEVHLGCTRDEQVRWLNDAWEAARDARAGGADVRAVTAWAAFGSHNWHCLVTRDDGHYEPGLFDSRGPTPRPTALARLARELASGNQPQHSVLGQPGWWERDDRFLFEPSSLDSEEREEAAA